MWFFQSGEWACFVVPVLLIALIVMGFVLPTQARDDTALRVWLWIVTVVLILAVGSSIVAAVSCRRQMRSDSVTLVRQADYGTSPARSPPFVDIALDSDE